MPDSGFTGATPQRRLAAMFDPGSGAALPSTSSLQLMAGTVGGRQVLAAATDQHAEKGVFGLAECADLRALVRLARDSGRPLALLLDSAGARLYDGIAIQGALRALMTEMLDAALDGLPLIALLGRNVFGGASMLAFAANHRCYAPNTLLAMSGPRVLQDGGHERETVLAAIDGSARCRHGASEELLDDTLPAYARALRRWLAAPVGACPAAAVQDERRSLERRLRLQRAPAGRLVFELGPGTLSCREPAPVGAADALRLATLVAAAQGALELRLDCSGHSVRLVDERLLQSQYLVHLAKTLRLRVRAGAPLRLRIGGAISGGLYIAAAGAASSVDIAPGGSVRTLPPATLEHILHRSVAGAAGAPHYAELGVADRVSP
ncbi:hypothetical protein AAKU55_005084 [Oxalobacteraceae bacterium GrIS 1.11]